MKKTLLNIVVAILALPVFGQAAVLRVKSGGTGNGSSWSAALGSIDAAMNQANVGDEIWVAAKPIDASGINFYYDSSTYTGSGVGEILVKDGVSLYGGFNGTETSRDQRDPKTNVTTLLLQLRVRMLQDLPTVIDGFKFINGTDMVVLIGDAGSAGTCQQLTISNNVFKNGGAPAGSIYANQAPFRCNATIQGNAFYAGSSPIYIPSGAPKILSNFFSEAGDTQREGITVGSGGATSTGAVVANNVVWGMGVTIKSSGVLVANNTIAGGLSGPTLTNTFGLITNSGTTVVNNIVAFYGNGIFAFDFITANHNLVYGNGANYVGLASPGAGDMQSDPRFLDRTNGDFHLTGTSPAINAGDTSIVQAGWVDFQGLARVFPQGGLVDIGGSEYGSSANPSSPTNQPPQVNAPTAAPSLVTGLTTQLAVAASDPDNDPLSYQWTASSAPAAVDYSNQAGPTTGITFHKSGSYTFQVTVSDGHGHSVTPAPVTVTVTAVASALAINPSQATVSTGNSQTLAASVADQFGNSMGAAAPATTWTMSPSGMDSRLSSTSGSSISFTAGSTPQSYTVTAQSSSLQATASLIVPANTVPNPPIIGSGTTLFSPSSAPTSYFTYLPVELGVKFRSDVNGTITGIRFFKAAGDTSIHTGSLWSSSGALLATGTFSGETGSGWQQLNFSTPVAITANTTYTASYHTNGGFYYSFFDFQNTGIDNAPLHALKDGVDGPNGVFFYGAGGVFPTQSYESSNYWVDAVFAQSAPTTIFSASSAPAAYFTYLPVELGVKFRSDINGMITGVRFYKGAGDTSIHTGSLWSSSGALLATGTFSGETGSGWQQLNFSTPVAITANTTYIASYHTNGGFYYSFFDFQNTGIDNAPLHALKDGVDGPNGVFFYGAGGVFPTLSYESSNYWVDAVFAQSAPTTIFSASSAPAAYFTYLPVELGVKFRSDVNGMITGVRFYKGAGDTSIHTGSLWSSSGALLATGTFSGETDSGWQQLNFSAPVAITANTTYTASYHTNGGFYYSFFDFQNAGIDNAPLHALKDGVDGPNGVYFYGAGGVFPTLSYESSRYWVDVVFARQ